MRSPLTHYEAMAAGYRALVGHKGIEVSQAQMVAHLDNVFTIISHNTRYAGRHVLHHINPRMASAQLEKMLLSLIGVTQGGAESYANWITPIAAYASTGKLTFCTSPGLTSMLAHTDPTGVYGSVRLPFQAFYVTLGQRIHRLVGADEHDGGRKWADEIAGYYFLDMPEDIMITAVGDPLQDENADSSWHHALIPKGWLATRQSSMIGVGEIRAASSERSGKKNSDGAMELDVLSLALNILLYMTSHTPDISKSHVDGIDLRSKLSRTTKPKTRRRLEAELAGVSCQAHQDLGRAITIDLTHVPERVKIGHGATVGWKLTYRLIVRGHWRDQRYGPGNALTRRIWIMPHFRGPDTASEVHRRYEVDGAASGTKGRFR